MVRFTCALLTLVALGLLLGPSLAQQPAMPRPGPEHERLKGMVGEWDCVMEMMGQEHKASSVCTLDLGGFWVTEKFNGEFGGMKFEGRGTFGYCPIKKKYVGTWIDSMSPSMMVMEGTCPDENPMIMTGEGPDESGKMVKHKTVTVRKGNDAALMTMYKVNGNQEEKVFTITYKRKK
jgi:hypothetical protein